MLPGFPPGAAAGGAAVAAAAVIANAIKASGAIVRMHPAEFERLLHGMESPLVVCASGGLFWTTHRYLFGYKGMVFFTKASAPLRLPPGTEIVQAETIWIPN
jgi:hypothetical protein